MPEKLYVPVDKLQRLVTTIFEKNGLTNEDAATLAGSLLDANIRGMHSHGVLRVENYIKRIQQGGTDPHADIRIVHETPFSATIDGGNGLGAIVSSRAVDICRRKAEENGIACVAVRNSNHYGTAAYYCERLAKNDMIAFSCSNVEPLMAPPGATRVAIGNNPFCMVAPAGRHPFISSDMATSQVAWGKVLDYRLKDQKLPGPWGVDENGSATDDPHAARFLAPMGAHKGYGIAVLLEILSSLLSGGQFGTDINSMYGTLDKPNNLSHFFMAMKISAFRDLQEYRDDMDRFIEYLQSIPTADGGHIIVPGELEERNKQKALRDGIEITDGLCRELLEMAFGPLTGAPEDYLAKV